MIFTLEKRSDRAAYMGLLSPIIACLLTAIIGALLFSFLNVSPLQGLKVFFIDPFLSLWSLEEMAIKASPLILIAIGLAIGYRANVWNIGAEGQLTMGAIIGAILPIYFADWQSPTIFIAMLIGGILGGMLYAAIPALLKIKFDVNEILSSLMLVYIAQLILDYLVRGPWKDPDGFNFPQSRPFEGWQLLPTIGEGRLHMGIIITLCVLCLLAIILKQTKIGFAFQITGMSPRASRFAGFNQKHIILACLLISGGCAGLAGIMEVMGPNGQLQPTISPGYGFTAIIVAFLGRLNPIGILFSGTVLAATYLGGESAQIDLNISDKTTQVFQGILLFMILACDTFILYRLKLRGYLRESGKILSQGS